MLSDLRIADLELFITAARLGSLGQAATLHYLSQSAASTAIRRVEWAFGETLCTHEKRQFRLTSEGKQLLEKAEQWLKTLKSTVVSKTWEPIRVVTTHAIARVAVPAILPIEAIDLKLMRPDLAYGAIVKDEADLALVLDNAHWKGVIKTELGKGYFQLFSKQKNAPEKPVLLPEDRIEVHTLQQKFEQEFMRPLPIKARLPSWSLIADICASSSEIGFLPGFLALDAGLHPVNWQPDPIPYKLLALYRKSTDALQKRIAMIVKELRYILKN